MEKDEIEKIESKFDENQDVDVDNKNRSNPFRSHANKIAKKTSATTVNIEIDGVDTHIPNNLPTAIFGDKGSGKSTLLRSISDLTNKKVFKHIFFVYSTLSIDEEFPDDVIRIEVSKSMGFLCKLFEIKAIFVYGKIRSVFYYLFVHNEAFYDFRSGFIIHLFSPQVIISIILYNCKF